MHLKRIGRYEIVRPLSKGGMALVFEARRMSLAGVSPRVAIKVILPQHADSRTFRELFINEARVGASMHHQNLVQIQDFDQDENGFFLVMEYVEGITLRSAITLCQRHGIPVPLEVIAELGRQACDGLDYAHTVRDEEGEPLDLVHRDIKPSNLILTPHGVVKILDFGIALARLMKESKGAVRGTWGYMAPEQAAGKTVKGQADIFGLGAVLFEMAARSALFPRKEPEKVKRLLQDDHAARMVATLDPEYRPLVGVLVRALQRDPAARYRNAAEFGRELSALLPDPVTVREQLSHFYDVVTALKAGRPVPAARSYGGVGSSALTGGAPTAGSAASIVASDVHSVAPPSRRKELLLGASALAAVLVVALLALSGVLALSMLLEPQPGPAIAEVVEQKPPARLPPGPAPKVEEPEPVEVAPKVAPKPRPAPTARPAPEPVVAPKPALPKPVRVVRAEVPAPAPAPAPEIRVVSPPPEPVVVEPPPASGPGSITVAATVPGSEVYIDGLFVRKVPLIDHELEAGDHLVGITAPNGLSKRFRVTVEAGETTTWNWDFDRQEFKKR